MSRAAEVSLDHVVRGSKPGRVVTRLAFGWVVVILLAPFVVMALTAVTGNRAIAVLPARWIPKQVAWSNFTSAFTAVPLARYFLNSTIIAGGSTVLNAFAAVPAAFALARLRFRGRRAFLLFIIATQMISPIVLLIAAFKLMVVLHMINTYWALIFMDGSVSLPITIWIMTAYFSGIPQEIQDAATLDGIGNWRILVDHFIPLGIPGIVTALVFSFVIAWNEFLFALTFVTNPTIRPLTTGIYAFVGEAEIQWNYLMAASLLSIVPVLLIFLGIQKRLAAGLVAGAVK
ncbi:MAG TPA: carbohydrate ABC transporter permease [Acidimicrobiales bacterium]|nr:carbohydrate ABC transporter permease [Acidimicrobiales bacterium]